MELKFKEVGKEYSVELSSGLKIRPYLKIEEINDIVNQCLATDNQIERELIKVCKTIEFCTNIDLGEGDIQGEEVYNMACEIGIINDIKIEIDNYDVIDECIDKSESIYVLIKEITKELNKSIESFDINKLQNSIGEIAKQVGEANGKDNK